MTELFTVAKGFRVDMVASEPMVVSPVAMAFDENGRLFVAEMLDYPFGGRESARRGRVRVLDEPDDEGVFQASTVYAENLQFPSALACYAGGVFAACTPNVYYLKDSQSGGGADLVQAVLTGFGGTNSITSDSLINSFAWGPDSRIHGVVSGLGGAITASNWSGTAVSLGRGDFSFDPRSLAVVREAGSARSGLSFDRQGRKLVSDGDRPLRMPMYEARYLARNPFYPPPAGLIDVIKPPALVYPETEATGGPAAEGSHSGSRLAARWMAGARGCLVYRGGALPTNYWNNVFIAVPDSHAIHRVVLREHGLGLVAERVAEDRNREFLVSRESSFRPVQVAAGPDGALYIVDMQDGGDRGRIYRVVPEKWKREKPASLAKASTRDLAAALAHTNGWFQDTAARLLYERQDPAANSLLAGMVNNSRLPEVRWRALRALAANGGLTETMLLKGLQDPDPRVREHAIVCAEPALRQGGGPESLWNQFRALTADPVLSVRYQLAFSLGEANRPQRPFLLAQVFSRDLHNPWMQNAVLSASGEGAATLFTALAAEGRLRNDAVGFEFLRQLATMIGTQGRANEVTQAAGWTGWGSLSRYETFALLGALGEGLHRTRSSLPLVDPQNTLQPIYNSAFNTAVDVAQPEQVRVEAIHLLAYSSFNLGDLGDWLLLLSSPPPIPAVQLAALRTLCHYDDPTVMTVTLNAWRGLPAAVRRPAVAMLLSRASRVRSVLEAVETGRIGLADLAPAQRNFLRTYPDEVTSKRAVKILGPVPERRPQVVERYKPALKLRGNSRHGQELFRLRCAECHSGSTPGGQLGPNLATARIAGKEKLLTALLEPHAELTPGYVTALMETQAGEVVLGIRGEENSQVLTMHPVGERRIVWPRENIQAVRPQSWSLMPEGLEEGLSPQDVADLLDFIMTMP